MPTSSLSLHLGVKADPIEYRYSYEWLFRVLREEGIHHVQIGTFFEIYQLPDDFFLGLKQKAQDYDIAISSIFTAHRELGGFFRTEPGFMTVARRNFERLIEVGSLLGVTSVGSNPGAVLRDQMGMKEQGILRYVENLKELMHFAHDKQVPFLGIEPMSCLAEPPTLPNEIRRMAEELLDYHFQHPDTTSRVGYCTDISHGYADRERCVVFDNQQLFEAAVPYTHEIHLKNTDAIFNSTFGFTEEQRKKGIVDIPWVRELLLANAGCLPVQEIVAYLEIGGPKTGRDYSDGLLEQELRESLVYLKQSFLGSEVPPQTDVGRVPSAPRARNVQVSPSLMCADLCHLEDQVRRLEGLGVDYLHMDIMDAHFVPNMPLGLETLRHLRPKTALPFDVHLMVDNNDFFIREMAAVGVQLISVHAETSVHLDHTLSLIQSLGAKAGVALNPATPLSTLEYVLEKLDFILLMTVNPGYSGQRLVDSTLDKIAQCRRMLDLHGLKVPIEVDGNVSFEHIPRMVAAGADILVAGTSSLFARGGSLHQNHKRMLHAIQEGLNP